MGTQMHKVVNGIVIELTEEEAVARLAEEQAWAEAKAAAALVAYREQRVAEYPPIGDQLDAILKSIQLLIDQKILSPSSEMVDILTKVADVKAKYPKTVATEK